jgi:acetyltransferase-like isoleucine patch superfamily enzyme
MTTTALTLRNLPRAILPARRLPIPWNLARYETRSAIRRIGICNSERKLYQRLMILFGVRSPLVVDFEETLRRLGLAVAHAVSVNGVPRLLNRDTLVDLSEFSANPGDEFIVPAFAPVRRRELWDHAIELELAPCPPLVDPHAVLPNGVRIGRGSFVNAGVVVGSLSMIGEGVLVNRSASLGHHCVLADFVSIGPGATLAGNIHVGAGSIIGAGAVILPNVRIGAGSIVSAGAVVRNPARPHRFNPARSSLAVEDGE